MENNINDKVQDENSLILDKLMNTHSYFPKNKEFESTDPEISNDKNFFLKFDKLLINLREFDQNFTKYINENEFKKDENSYNKILEKYLLENKFEDSILKVYFKEFWRRQKAYNKNHIFLFFIFADKYLQNYDGKNFSKYDKNILYWTILFHDLGKHINMTPIIKENINMYMADKTHPFKSVIIFLNFILEKNLFYFPNDNYKNDLINYYKNEFSNGLYKSWKLEKYKKYKRYNISFSYIDNFEKFFFKIKEEEKNEWIYDICVLITFHQSLPNNDEKMNDPLLEEKYIKIFFTKRLLELMRVIMIYDSASHSLFSEGNWSFQINKHIDELIKLYN